ncbi:hypothetical protein L1987_25560 [Smallanthus sonchifolius]|uniref:Uncharacterized protein n=1 Tax=Smallanthus sonchifolius TaxID=185202 RepID=A0ACB9I879_9ASTR|nr:hypothetical protein L1987_25560 [Smallanthus sonchifolius]
MLSGEAAGGHGLGDRIAPSPTVSVGESVSQLPDVHVHVPGSGLESESDVNGIDEIHLVSAVGVHASVGIDGEVNPNEWNETSISSAVQVDRDGVGTAMQLDNLLPDTNRDDGMHASTKPLAVASNSPPTFGFRPLLSVDLWALLCSSVNGWGITDGGEGRGEVLVV